LRREPAVNFGAILEHPRPRHSVMACPENSEPSAFGTDGFLFLLGRGRFQDSVRVLGRSVGPPVSGLCALTGGLFRLLPCVSERKVCVIRKGLALRSADRRVSEKMDPERCRA
jgi:hypothetical protein